MCHKNKEEKSHCGMNKAPVEQETRKFGKCFWSQKQVSQEQEAPPKFSWHRHHFHGHGHGHHHHHHHHHCCSPAPPSSCHGFHGHHFHGQPHRHHCGPPLIMTPRFSAYYYEAMKD